MILNHSQKNLSETKVAITKNMVVVKSISKFFALLSVGSLARKNGHGTSWKNGESIYHVKCFLKNSASIKLRLRLQSYCIQEKSYVQLFCDSNGESSFVFFFLECYHFLGLIWYFCFREFQHILWVTSGNGCLGWNGCYIPIAMPMRNAIDNIFLEEDKKYLSLITNLN